VRSNRLRRLAPPVEIPHRRTPPLGTSQAGLIIGKSRRVDIFALRKSDHGAVSGSCRFSRHPQMAIGSVIGFSPLT
jgi:hypothetical protein